MLHHHFDFELTLTLTRYTAQTAMNVAQVDGLLPALNQALVRSDEAQTVMVAGNALANFASHAEIRPVLREVHATHIASLQNLRLILPC